MASTTHCYCLLNFINASFTLSDFTLSTLFNVQIYTVHSSFSSWIPVATRYLPSYLFLSHTQIFGIVLFYNCCIIRRSSMCLACLKIVNFTYPKFWHFYKNSLLRKYPQKMFQSEYIPTRKYQWNFCFCKRD